uniref:Putative secreted peptide n=1 Tax=Anopheles braziliensis TaxID=58242 RepID=A0A2M3ZU01_9DIPT
MGRRILPQSALRRFMIAPCLMSLPGWPVSTDPVRVYAGSLLQQAFFRFSQPWWWCRRDGFEEGSRTSFLAKC